MRYRDESFVILLVNAWELLLKAILSKAKQRVFYPKRPDSPYRSLSVSDALVRVESYFPPGVPYKPTAENLRLLIQYRDSAIHFYNRVGMGSLVYGLSQTAIVNYRDMAAAIFGRDIAGEITLSLLPLSIAPPVDPIVFLRERASSKAEGPVERFSRGVRDLVSELEADGEDTGRFFTTFSVHLVSTKKIASADLVVGVSGGTTGSGPPLLVSKTVDPNKTHPYRESDVIGRKGGPRGLSLKIGSFKVGQIQFRALVKFYDAKSKLEYCWRDETGAITRYSPAWIDFIRRLKEEDLSEALRSYRSN